MSALGVVVASDVHASPLFVAATFGGGVVLWDAGSRYPVAAFPTIFAGVLGRIALSMASGQPVVAAAALNRRHLVAYDGMSGEVIWERTDTRPVLRVSAPPRLGSFAVTPSRGPMLLVSVLNGSTVETIPGARELHVHPREDLAIARGETRTSIVDCRTWKALRKLSLQGWDLLDVAFGVDSILVSDVAETSAIYSFDRLGKLEWRQEVEPGWNVPWLAFDRKAGEWLGVVQDPEQHSPHRLTRWSSSGSVVRTTEIGIAQDYAFVLDGTLLVSPHEVFDARSGGLVGRLAVT